MAKLMASGNYATILRSDWKPVSYPGAPREENGGTLLLKLPNTQLNQTSLSKDASKNSR